jgi:hypothetical protein
MDLRYYWNLIMLNARFDCSAVLNLRLICKSIREMVESPDISVYRAVVAVKNTTKFRAEYLVQFGPLRYTLAHYIYIENKALGMDIPAQISHVDEVFTVLRYTYHEAVWHIYINRYKHTAKYAVYYPQSSPADLGGICVMECDAYVNIFAYLHGIIDLITHNRYRCGSFSFRRNPRLEYIIRRGAHSSTKPAEVCLGLSTVILNYELECDMENRLIVAWMDGATE